MAVEEGSVEEGKGATEMTEKMEGTKVRVSMVASREEGSRVSMTVGWSWR